MDTLAKDLRSNYRFIVRDYLNKPMDSGQVFSVKKFIEVHDKTGINAPIDTKFKYREKELDILKSNIETYTVNLSTGPAGLGKTRLTLDKHVKHDDDI